MFYAVLALLAARQTETSRHSGAIAQFDELYVKPALLQVNSRAGFTTRSCTASPSTTARR